MVTTKGASVESWIHGREPLNASHPTFSVRKPTLVFRAIGNGVKIDDLQVRDLSPQPQAPR